MAPGFPDVTRDLETQSQSEAAGPWLMMISRVTVSTDPAVRYISVIMMVAAAASESEGRRQS